MDPGCDLFIASEWISIQASAERLPAFPVPECR